MQRGSTAPHKCLYCHNDAVRGKKECLRCHETFFKRSSRHNDTTGIVGTTVNVARGTVGTAANITNAAVSDVTGLFSNAGSEYDSGANVPHAQSVRTPSRSGIMSDISSASRQSGAAMETLQRSVQSGTCHSGDASTRAMYDSDVCAMRRHVARYVRDEHPAWASDDDDVTGGYGDRRSSSTYDDQGTYSEGYTDYDNIPPTAHHKKHHQKTHKQGPRCRERQTNVLSGTGFTFSCQGCMATVRERDQCLNCKEKVPERVVQNFMDNHGPNAGAQASGISGIGDFLDSLTLE
jgi:hypothetical protein